MRALAESAYRHGAKFVDVAYFDLHIKRARLRYAADGHARLRAVLVRRAHPRARRPALRPDRAQRPDRPGPARRHRPGADRPRPAAVPARERQGRQRRDDELDDRPVPEPRRGRRSCIPDLEPEAALAKLVERAACTSCGSTRRTRSPRGRARADALVDGRDAAHRAALRRPALRGAGHRSAGRPAAVEPLRAPRASRPSTASSTCRTCRPRRSSARRTRCAPRASCARRSRSSSAARSSAGSRCEFRDGRVMRIDAEENADVLRGYTSKDDGRRAARRGRARRPRGPDRQARDDVLRHAARRERREPHRARVGATPSASRTPPTASG